MKSNYLLFCVITADAAYGRLHVIIRIQIPQMLRQPIRWMGVKPRRQLMRSPLPGSLFCQPEHPAGRQLLAPLADRPWAKSQQPRDSAIATKVIKGLSDGGRSGFGIMFGSHDHIMLHKVENFKNKK